MTFRSEPGTVIFCDTAVVDKNFISKSASQSQTKIHTLLYVASHGAIKNANSHMVLSQIFSISIRIIPILHLLVSDIQWITHEKSHYIMTEVLSLKANQKNPYLGWSVWDLDHLAIIVHVFLIFLVFPLPLSAFHYKIIKRHAIFPPYGWVSARKM